MTATYTYLVADLRTNTILAELPLVNVSYEHALNTAGSFSASLKLGDKRIAQLDSEATTTPTRTAIYVDRNGEIVWGGIIWSRNYSSENSTLQLGGLSFESFGAKHHIRPSADYAQVDQLSIARDLWFRMSNLPGANIGVVLGTELSGRLRDRTYLGYELKPVLEAIEQLSQVNDGFDWRIHAYYDGAGLPAKRMEFGYPRFGKPAVETGFVFEYPGNVISYTWPEDGRASATHVYTVGSGQEYDMIITTATNSAWIAGGGARLEDVTTYKDVTRLSTLQAHAIRDLAERAPVPSVPELTVTAHGDPEFGTYGVGDGFKLEISDYRFPAKIDETTGDQISPGHTSEWRMTSIATSPGAGGQPEKIQLKLEK